MLIQQHRGRQRLNGAAVAKPSDDLCGIPRSTGGTTATRELTRAVNTACTTSANATGSRAVWPSAKCTCPAYNNTNAAGANMTGSASASDTARSPSSDGDWNIAAYRSTCRNGDIRVIPTDT